MLEEIYHALKVKLRTEQVKEYVLTVALIELRYNLRELVLHRECTRCVTEARHHLSH